MDLSVSSVSPKACADPFSLKEKFSAFTGLYLQDCFHSTHISWSLNQMSIQAAWNICAQNKRRTLSPGLRSSSHIEQAYSFKSSKSEIKVIGKLRFKSLFPIPCTGIYVRGPVTWRGLTASKGYSPALARISAIRHFTKATVSQTTTTNTTKPRIIQIMNS